VPTSPPLSSKRYEAGKNNFYVPEAHTLYGAVDFLNVLKKGCWWGGGGGGCVLQVHSEIYYAPVDEGWEEVLVCNVLHLLHTCQYFFKLEYNVFAWD
jgi:hypothetical protein